MNRETIKKAAKEAVQNHFQCNGEYPCEERDYCEFCNGHNSAFDCNEDCGADDFNEGFIAGADWRINSVWHDVQKELPAPDKTVIAEYIIDGERDYCFTHRSESPRVSVDKHGFCFYIRGAEIIRWAYLEDLLPDRKEVQL